MFDTQGNTAVHTCVLYGRIDCLEAIIAACASRPGLLHLDIKNFDELTPLHLAVRTSKLDLIKCLVKSGASPYTTDAKTGDTILHTAVEHRALKSTKYILEIDTEKKLVNLINRADKTPLQVLFVNYTDDNDDEEETLETDLVIGKYLVENGADTSGISPLLLRQIKSSKEVEEELVKEIEKMPPPAPVSDDKHVTSANIIGNTKKQEVSSESTSIPLKFDKIATEELNNILTDNELWREIAKSLDMEQLTSVWESTKAPTQCLLDYIQVSLF